MPKDRKKHNLRKNLVTNRWNKRQVLEPTADTDDYRDGNIECNPSNFDSLREDISDDFFLDDTDTQSNDHNNNAEGNNKSEKNNYPERAVPDRMKNIQEGVHQKFISDPHAESDEYFIIHKSSLSHLWTNLKCPHCNSMSPDIRICQRYGVANRIEVICRYCEDSGLNPTQGTTLTSPNTNPHMSDVFDINLRMTLDFLHIRRGYSALDQFSKFTNMSPMSERCFRSNRDVGKRPQDTSQCQKNRRRRCWELCRSEVLLECSKQAGSGSD